MTQSAVNPTKRLIALGGRCLETYSFIHSSKSALEHTHNEWTNKRNREREKERERERKRDKWKKGEYGLPWRTKDIGRISLSPALELRIIVVPARGDRKTQIDNKCMQIYIYELLFLKNRTSHTKV